MAVHFSKITGGGGGGGAADYFAHVAKPPGAKAQANAEARGETTAGRAVGYYESEQGAPSAWHGRGAEALGLTGSVDRQRFIELLDGQISDGVSVAQRGNVKNRVMATDFSFSAPKSISLVMAAEDEGRAEAIRQAHDAAVRDALDQMQEQMAGTRYGKAGRHWQATGSILAATFRHEDARPIDGRADPQLHTHAVVTNLTQRADGTWAAMRFDFGKNSEKYKALDQTYQASLAARLEVLGYATRRAEHGIEIEGVYQATIEKYSRRGKAIDEALTARGIDRETATDAELQSVKYSTRDRKLQITESQQRADWRSRLREDIDLEAVRGAQAKREAARQAEAQGEGQKIHADSQANEDGADAPAQPGRTARERHADTVVASAVRHMAERDAVFSHAGLRREIANAALEAGGLTGAEVAGAIERRAGGLVYAGKNTRGDQTWTTRGQINRELELDTRVREGRGQAAPIMDAEAAEAAISAREDERGGAYTAGQRAAIAGLLTSDTRYEIVNGAAGVGKTTLLRAVVAEYQAAGFEVVGIGPSHQAVQEMQGAGFDRLMTSARFTLAGAGEPGEDAKPRLYVVDEAGMASTRDALAAVRRIDAEGSRAVFVGDPDQLAAVEAGSPLAGLIHRGAAPVHSVREIVRQRDENLLAVAQAYADGDADRAWEGLKQYVETVDKGGVAERVASAWLAGSQEQREHTMIVVAKNTTRRQINEAVRDGLKAEGALGAEDQTLTTLERTRHTDEMLKRVSSYREGNFVQFRDDKSIWRIEAIDASAQTITLSNAETGELMDWKPGKDQRPAIYYEAAQLDIANGERVIFRENDRELGIHNGLRGTVISEAGEPLRVATDDGREIALPDRPLAIQHGYARTTWSAQGADDDAEIWAGEAIGRDTELANLAYVNATRAKDSLQIITDDPGRLEAVSRQWAPREQAVDVAEGTRATREGERAADAWRARHEQEKAAEAPDQRQEATRERRAEAQGDRLDQAKARRDGQEAEQQDQRRQEQQRQQEAPVVRPAGPTMRMR